MAGLSAGRRASCVGTAAFRKFLRAVLDGAAQIARLRYLLALGPARARPHAAPLPSG